MFFTSAERWQQMKSESWTHFKSSGVHSAHQKHTHTYTRTHTHTYVQQGTISQPHRLFETALSFIHKTAQNEHTNNFSGSNRLTNIETVPYFNKTTREAMCDKFKNSHSVDLISTPLSLLNLFFTMPLVSVTRTLWRCQTVCCLLQIVNCAPADRKNTRNPHNSWEQLKSPAAEVLSLYCPSYF